MYWENDAYRRPDRIGHRKGNGRLKYHWFRIDAKIDEIFEKYGMAKITVRKLYYLLGGTSVIPSLKKAYGSLDKHMTEGREKGRWLPNCLVDDRHPPVEINDNILDPANLLNDLLDEVYALPELYVTDTRYKMPRWHKQKNYVELWTEKEAAVSNLIEIIRANDLQVRIVPFGGFPGFANLDRHARRLVSKMKLNKNIHIFIGTFIYSNFIN